MSRDDYMRMPKAKKIFRAIDLYCGAGGTTNGAIASGRVQVVLAVNHWRTAIYTHENNHPETRHICAPIEYVNPADFANEKIDMIFASPECTHHSVARGGRPVNDQKRAGGWEVLKWVETLRPSYLIIENVREWRDWGPVGTDGRPLKSKKGQLFKAWVASLRALNYRVEWRLLNAADYGEATSRTRLFVIARLGNKKIKWPKPTHARHEWEPAAKIIDWQEQCPSIFNRKIPLADKTLRRIEIGIRKFCAQPDGRPFVVKLRGTSNVVDVLDPVPTITAGGNHLGLALPFLVPNFGERRGQKARTHSIDAPLPAVTGHGAGQLVVPFLLQYHNGDGCERRTSSIADPLPTVDTNPRHALVSPFILDVNHGGNGDGRTHSLKKPLKTLSTKNGKVLCLPFLTTYFGTGHADSINEPLSTLTTKERHGLAMVSLIKMMNEYQIVDIGFRMLTTKELLRAQGFPDNYKLHGTKAEMTKQIGNSVCVKVAKAICEALAA
jgi:DNA (cytosine-5)-methyltransferase 1